HVDACMSVSNTTGNTAREIRSCQRLHHETVKFSRGAGDGVERDTNTTYVDDHFLYHDNVHGFRITVAILYLVVCVLGLAGNSLVVIAILKLDKLSSCHHASQNFQNVDVRRHGVQSGDGSGRPQQFTSIFCLTAMSIDRYMALADPLKFA
ncbi:hypothetical protein KUCAC02_033032, partial [Chaenocephalus aceratus]